MSNSAVSVLEFVGSVQKTIAQDFERENDSNNNVLIVQQIDIELKTVLGEAVKGGVEWKLITLEGNYSNAQTQTLSLSWERKTHQASFTKAVNDMEYALITGLDALRIGAAEWAQLSGLLPYQSRGGKLVFEVSVDEEGNLAIGNFGGSVNTERMHTVTLTLAPLS
ncbi:hypothetical protein FNU79_17725 [Deinococcus detaillensis]|uniref:Uncharacterized protein n=1 Tax=Deinococcus detaillensis TaxID=2592048 RepID=A0A553UH39_9DEIO|nr:trypco2 family protein [Deinococcus detaillensis]TSA79530.1 hypothetical protein FNU79_17725 [Deinococcus detaillensis]